MTRISFIWHDRDVGTIAVPDSFRPPISQLELAAIPTTFFIRSRSWLFDVRQGDVTLQLRTRDGREEIVAVSQSRLGPGDVGLIIGFEPTEGFEQFSCDPEIEAYAAKILREAAER